MYVGAFSLFLLAEGLLFVTLFALRFLYAGPSGSPSLRPGGAFLIGAVFVASLVPIWLAARESARTGSASPRALAAAFLLGALALGGVIVEWRSVDIPPAIPLGGLYFITAGVHVVHIVGGLIFLAGLWSRSRRPARGARDAWLFRAGALFWSFVAITWLALVAVFYLPQGGVAPVRDQLPVWWWAFWMALGFVLSAALLAVLVLQGREADRSAST